MTNERRKLRVLVISMGGPRQEAIDAMFAKYSDDFEPPAFCPGIPARTIRVRSEFYRIAHTAGLIPDVEWDALQEGFQTALYQEHPNRFFECLQNVPVTTIGRLGSTSDLEVHYSVELWRKSKGLNRGRSVLACMLAHLLAMKRLVEEGFDLIVEDNVRLCHDSARRIWDTIVTSESEECHLRYYGWLGSLPNLEWVLDVHGERSGLTAAPDKAFYFPIPDDFDDLEDPPQTGSSRSTTGSTTPEIAASSSCPTLRAHQTAGGTPIWGAYSYWISRDGYDAVLRRLRCDVGAMLWKGKRMRAYVVKPIDKVLPRQVVATFGRTHVHVTRQPAFFRAPMLTSKIHAQWDPEFCKSTQYQLSRTNLTWNDLWLTSLELKIVQHYETTGEWLTIRQVEDGTQ